MHSLLEAAVDGDVRALGKALSVIEDGTSELPELLSGLPDSGSALLIGVTGPPGVGKSTTTGALISEYRNQSLRVAVLAVDPSSPVTGGALLGDRIRMQEHALDEGVFIRSMSSRGQLGGLSSATQAAAKVLDAVGFDVIIVETVGVGQSEVDVVNAVDTVVLVLAPGAGDGVQAAKAGILEIADVYVVNKADRDGAEGVVRELRSMIGLGSASSSSWTPEIVTTVATTGQGLPELVQAIAKHHEWAVSSGDRALRSVERAKLNLRRAVLDSLTEQMNENRTTLDSLSAQVASGAISTELAVNQILRDLNNS
ncbi:MAG: methylmalonyl Co-A mutase-associated GTPase MeaB [Actinobacteria bacterium]|jgi:LAO/AO transport system kinase|nr:methylmalonyl Co-A mutase-associated GTPase MeaB [Actinomycetota bacterium]